MELKTAHYNYSKTQIVANLVLSAVVYEGLVDDELSSFWRELLHLNPVVRFDLLSVSIPSNASHWCRNFNFEHVFVLFFDLQQS